MIVNSKLIGAMLILGPILTMGVWMVYSVDTSGMSPSDSMAAIIADVNKAKLSSILNVFGVMSMFTGLHLLARSLKSDNAVSNACAEIGGLFLVLLVPVWVIMMGADISALGAAQDFGVDVGVQILTASTLMQTSGILLVVGMFLLGISFILLKKYKRIIGILFVVTSGLAFIDMLFEPNTDIVGMIGWMGMFVITLVTGILTTIQKDS